ncbi:MAG: RNA polymerase sigma factor [Acidobacteria bacterium]|nr:RNA polymerase sigma factor [Acidobacteriota bacterium]
MTYTDLRRASTLDEASADFAMDEEAFRAFYERTARGLWAYLSRVTGDRQQADDLLQETFYRFLRAGSRYESEAHRRNALYRIATNLARDSRRRHLARTPATVAGHDVESVPSGQDPAAADRRADFARAMTSLKPRERAMLWLAYAEGSSHQEIAQTLGLSAASLKPLLARARRKLALLLNRSSAKERS